ncbi:S8 family peptidase [Ferrimonas balearica]|uniref:S8 family peptidase n=1 Tax=Ferrimonas balearica TaxID=44012 RepID=UPI001C96242A|nr:S8 family peptidase [Ferrimonas balearica]MBY6108281.1 S8 family peptidase [Ferrimonas balearica]
MKNFLIGYGETLTSKVEVKSGGGGKKHPYSTQEGVKRFSAGLMKALNVVNKKPADECANGEVVIKMTQHPTYLAKSYYPKTFFKRYGLKDVGSKSVVVKPDRWATKKHPEQATAACIYVSASKDCFFQLLNTIESGELDKATLESLRTFETVSTFDAGEKIKSIRQDQDDLYLEVVIHASDKDHYVIEAFEAYSKKLGGLVVSEKSKVVGGLTFLPLRIKKGAETELAKFSHLRALRSVPALRLNKPNALRQVVAQSVQLPKVAAVDDTIKVCIFDGGLGDHHMLDMWATEVIPEDVQSTSPDYLSHGGEVCSAYLFGSFDKDTGTLSTPYTKVDLVRVVSPDDADPDLFDVLTRIDNTLLAHNYKFVNLSLGPQMPIEDDDVHVWTSVLEKHFEDGQCLATVAIGNDGELAGEDSRIQPPSDMVNCLSVGASNTLAEDWQRASYSCLGPGRSPGTVKPDGVAFGGSEGNLLPIYSPRSGQVIGTLGTSFSAPLALRVAAGIDAISEYDLSPSTIRALMIHKAERGDRCQREVGWGRFPSSPEEVVTCLDDEAIIVFQGELAPSEHVRIPIPVPKGVRCKWVHLKATFCINASTDPEHPLNYTQSGLVVSFRPNDSKFSRSPDGKLSQHPATGQFFTDSDLYPSEQDLRDEAHKWETCISRKRRFKLDTLSNPKFDVKYHAREQGAPAEGDLKPIKYSLVVSIRTQGDTTLYNSILQQNQTLAPIKISNRVRVQ